MLITSRTFVVVLKEINLLFDELLETENLHQPKAPQSNYEKIITEVAEEFSGGSAKVKSRNKDKDEIKVKIAKLKRNLKKTRNTRNYRLRSANKNRADKRASLNAQITDLEQTLKDLDLEVSSQ